MKPSLTFQTQSFRCSELGPENSTPDLISGSNIQNKTNFYLDEEDEIYEGYGKKETSYPYRQYTCYNRKLFQKEMKTAVLENDFLKAVFLPEVGGRLWSLLDKKTGKNLLYTNDVIRPGNLAICNAWVSGGVEWNISMIGHTPFTMEPLFTAELENEAGEPVLRMYEYERVRHVTYQMDFWLGEGDEFLHCRMRIVNQTDQVVPMYWWSNMAVPEYEKGRVIVPASEAFTNRPDGVYKVEIPMVEGIDVTRYKDIPRQVDYFFHIPQDSRKYIANLNQEGYGLLHMSTSRLQSRKLFSWGNQPASDNWQKFLTDQAGRYLEIQAGLGKTQYGCIPMAPHTAWEWLELYGPVQTSQEVAQGEFQEAERVLHKIVDDIFEKNNLEKELRDTKQMAKTKGRMKDRGNTYGAFANELRLRDGEPGLSEQLDFGEVSLVHREFLSFLETGVFPEPDPCRIPGEFISEKVLHHKLLETIKNENRENWYAHYQLGLGFFEKKHYKHAEECVRKSLEQKENPWALHALAVLDWMNQKKEQAAEEITVGYAMVRDDLTYLKETWKILLLCEAYEKLLHLYKTLPEDFAKESRIYFGYLTALVRTGKEKEALEILNRQELVLTDLRECEDSLGSLWNEAYEKVHGEKGTLPLCYAFDSL